MDDAGCTPVKTVQPPSPARRQPLIDILQDSPPTTDTLHPAQPVSPSPHRSALVELTQSCLNQEEPSPADALVDKLAGLRITTLPDKTQNDPSPARGRTLQRPQLHAQTFQPLQESEAIPEPLLNRGDLVSDNAYIEETAYNLPTSADQLLAIAREERSRILNEIENHQRGQYKWIVSLPATTETSGADSSDNASHTQETSDGNIVYGCNLLTVNQPMRASADGTTSSAADSFTLIATPLNLTQDPAAFQPEQGSTPMPETIVVQMADDPPPYESVVIKEQPAVQVSECTEPAEPTTQGQDQETGTTLHDQQSTQSPMTLSRIEDSLAEIDDLEDELDAIKQVASPRSVNRSPRTSTANGESSLRREVDPSKRVSFAGSSSTMRVKTTEKTRPSLRRSASLTLRDKTDRATELSDQPPQASASQAGSVVGKGSASVKSTKPLTIPKFELPGEAVARRLKEQREARRAQQAEAQDAVASPARAIAGRRLTKPTFELPGEAISRRKREEHEAKLKAQEEEERKRREFKARPYRAGAGPSTLPRGTIASRARQTRQETSDAAKRTSVASMRSLTSLDAASLRHQSMSSRGRNSMIMTGADVTRDMSRGTTSSAGSISGKRSSISVEDMAQQKLRGREILDQDSNYRRSKEQTRLNRESVVKSARELAAEQSRAASREWAEKKRRKELALRQSVREVPEPSVPATQ